MVTYDARRAKEAWRVLDAMQRGEMEQVVALNDPATGLLGYIVIHDTTRGPGLGGCRLWRYENAAEALADGVALARAMTRKCALAGLAAGGAKGVFIDHAGIIDRPEMLRALGRYVDSLGGRFYTSGDLGIGPADIAHIRETSRYVAVPDDKLDLSGAVAEGVLAAIRTSLIAAGLPPELEGKRAAVQGLGAMGCRVAAMLVKRGARVVATDIDPERRAAVAEELGLETCDSDAIYDADVDIFSPCAVSGVLNVQTIPRLSAKVVVGAANNQLGDDQADALMVERGIRYAPDYAVNSGAVILSALALRLRGSGPGNIAEVTARITETVTRIFHQADARDLPPGAVADQLADEALVRPKTTERQWWPIH
jgi:leucine dehydrogenase